MADPAPTAAHIDTIAEVMSWVEWGRWSDDAQPGHNRWTWRGEGLSEPEREAWQTAARDLLTSTDPDVHSALAANLPTQVMLDALTERGALTEETAPGLVTPDGRFLERWDLEGAHTAEGRHLVTPWQVNP